MNRNTARKLAEKITNEQLKQMFDNTKAFFVDWKRVSIVNKGLTKGTAWNVLGRDFDVNKTYHVIGKTNMIREFGEYLPKELKPKKKLPKNLEPPIHQEPKFNKKS